MTLNNRRFPRHIAAKLGAALVFFLASCNDGDERLEPSACARVRSGCGCEDGEEVCDSEGGSKTDAASGRVDAGPRVDAGKPATDDGGDDPQSDVDSGAGTSPDGGLQEAGASSPDAGKDDPPVSASGFVGEHGWLKVQNNRVVDEKGQPVQLRGMSLFWSQWSDFYLAQNVEVMVDAWKSTVIRAALGVENDMGYLQNAAANTAKVKTVVDRAIAKGIYVIIDWHDHHAQQHEAQAIAFFQEMAQAYGKQPHVLFEIYNEPMDVQWPVVKTYAEKIIATIRAAGAKNLIIVGTPTWSQDVDVAASSPITTDNNVAYTLHFYADTHKQAIRDKAKVALDKGLALFVTEWGTCSADGNGAVNSGETSTWLDFMKQNSISWANWALNNKAEACSALVPTAAPTGPWTDAQLTQSGKLVKPAIP